MSDDAQVWKTASWIPVTRELWLDWHPEDMTAEERAEAERRHQAYLASLSWWDKTRPKVVKAYRKVWPWTLSIGRYDDEYDDE